MSPDSAHRGGPFPFPPLPSGGGGAGAAARAQCALELRSEALTRQGRGGAGRAAAAPSQGLRRTGGAEDPGTGGGDPVVAVTRCPHPGCGAGPGLLGCGVAQGLVELLEAMPCSSVGLCRGFLTGVPPPSLWQKKR
ncbi:hypothetical protein LUU34_00619900 [Aix galericulata]|nr:hypothetical protein LUU34_00619900 [Aix galericulata]